MIKIHLRKSRDQKMINRSSDFKWHKSILHTNRSFILLFNFRFQSRFRHGRRLPLQPAAVPRLLLFVQEVLRQQRATAAPTADDYSSAAAGDGSIPDTGIRPESARSMAATARLLSTPTRPVATTRLSSPAVRLERPTATQCSADVESQPRISSSTATTALSAVN